MGTRPPRFFSHIVKTGDDGKNGDRTHVSNSGAEFETCVPVPGLNNVQPKPARLFTSFIINLSRAGCAPQAIAFVR